MLRDPGRLTQGRATAALARARLLPAPGAAADDGRAQPGCRTGWPYSTWYVSPVTAIEFAGVREYVPGDRQRRINWPASLRRGRLQVKTFAAERSQDVILLLDATTDIGEPGLSAIDLALRGATATARACLAARDRVGFAAYRCAGDLSGPPPRLGEWQVYRIIDAMLASQHGTTAGDHRAAAAESRRAARRARRGVQPAARPPVRRGPA